MLASSVDIEFHSCLPSCPLAFFNKDLTVIANGGPNSNVQRTSDHIQFLITETGPKTPKTPTVAAMTMEEGGEEKEVTETFELIAEQALVSPQIFCNVFPFHLMFDRDMRIVQAGKSVSRVMPKVAEKNCHLLDILDPIRPHIQLSFQAILSHISTIYVLKTRQDAMLEPDMFMRLKVCSRIMRVNYHHHNYYNHYYRVK